MFLEYIVLQLLRGLNLCNRNNVSRVYNVATIVWFQFMTHVMLFAMINPLVLLHQHFPKNVYSDQYGCDL
jgi:hypothetical protein